MKNLRFIPYIHRHQPIVKAAFAFDWALMTLVKSQPSVRWPQTPQSWYFLKRYFCVSQRMLKRIESPIDRILKNKNINILFRQDRTKGTVVN